MEQHVMEHKVWRKLIPLWKMMLLIICSAWLKNANKVLLNYIPQAQTPFSTNSVHVNLRHDFQLAGKYFCDDKA